MTPERKRRFNTFMGSGFILLGLLAWGLTVYFSLTPAPPRPHPVNLAPMVDPASCRSLLQRLDYRVTIQNGAVVATQPGLANPKEQLEQATLAIAACKMPLSTFCMGTDCDGAGLTFTLGAADAAPAKTPARAAPGAPARSGMPGASTSVRPTRPNVPTSPPARAGGASAK